MVYLDLSSPLPSIWGGSKAGDFQQWNTRRIELYQLKFFQRKQFFDNKLLH